MTDRRRQTAIAAATRTRATVRRCEAMLAKARAEHDAARARCVDAGVSMTELARLLDTSVSRISRSVARAGFQKELTKTFEKRAKALAKTKATKK